MTYEEALAALYEALPAFHRIGAAALKPGLENTLTLLERLGNPHQKFKSIHVAGTNGKGSSSHMLASILQEAGYKTGLYTSPHLKDYRERIRINGLMIPKERVVHFVEDELPRISIGIAPSFFEATVALCFVWFAEQEVDVAVIEVGLGGRLDSTNVIIPLVSLITNIGLDHQDLLGPTLQDIAREKAGIIKPGVPVVISQVIAETEPVFKRQAGAVGAPLIEAEKRWSCVSWSSKKAVFTDLDMYSPLRFMPALTGNYQIPNIKGVLAVVDVLREKGLYLSAAQVIDGLERVKTNTGLAGRWEILQHSPLVVADTAHNADGLSKVILQAEQATRGHLLTIIFGVVADKSLEAIYPILPRLARYIFSQPSVFRKLPASELASSVKAATGIQGETEEDVNHALAKALAQCGPQDMILITGSTFLVGDLDRIA